MSKLWISLAAALLTTIACHAIAADRPDDFAASVPLAIAGVGPWYAIELPMSVRLAARHADLRDLRVFNADGDALSYGLRMGATALREQAMEGRVRVFPLPGATDSNVTDGIRVIRNKAGTIVEVIPAKQGVGAPQQVRGWLLDLGQPGFAVRRLRLDWNSPVEGFLRFSIEASEDLKQWRYIGEEQIARLRFNGERIERKDVDLPEIRESYLRLTWLDPDAAVRLDGASVSGTLLGTREEPLVWSDPEKGRAARENEFTWNLPYALPLERVRIPLSQNSLAPVVIEGRSDAREPWRELARDVLYRLPVDGREVWHEEISLPSMRVSALRLRIDPRGSGLQGGVPQLSFALRTTEIIFLARGSQPFRLAVGNLLAADASLPLNTLIPGYDDGKRRAMGAAVLDGAIRIVSAPPAPRMTPDPAMPPVRSQQDWKRWGLWGVLLLGVALLAGMATSLLRSRAPEK